MMLLSDKDRHVKAKAAGALQSLAVDEDNQKKIKSLGAIPLITKLLSSRTPEVLPAPRHPDYTTEYPTLVTFCLVK